MSRHNQSQRSAQQRQSNQFQQGRTPNQESWRDTSSGSSPQRDGRGRGHSSSDHQSANDGSQRYQPSSFRDFDDETDTRQFSSEYELEDRAYNKSKGMGQRSEFKPQRPSGAFPRQEWDNEGGYTGTSQTNEIRLGNADWPQRYGQQYESGGPGRSQERDDMGRDGAGQAWASRESGMTKRGVAPRSYKRSDDRMCEDVCERLMDEGLDCSGVDVSVKDGVVTLTGEVDSRPDKHRIEQIAANVSGVSDVENQLRLAKRDTAKGATRTGNDTRGKHDGVSSTAQSGISAAATKGAAESLSSAAGTSVRNK